MRMKNVPKIQMFPNQCHEKKMKNEVIGSLKNPKSSIQWLEPWSWHSFDGDRRDGRGYGSFYF